MLTSPIIWGVDPSSKKLAVVVGNGKEFKFFTRSLSAGPTKRPRACAEAYDFGCDLLRRYPQTVLIGLEAPVGAPKGGVGSLTPQAMVSGAFQAALGYAQAEVRLVYNQLWKLSTTGYGHASKQEIADFVKENYPVAYQHCVTEAGKLDQDLLDAFGIWLHTWQLYIIKTKMVQIRAHRKQQRAGRAVR